MKYSEALSKAEQMYQMLTARDFSSTRLIEIRHEDGTHMYFRYAFARDLSSDWVVVYTEHNGFQVFCKGDLAEWYEWELKAVNGSSITSESETDEQST